MGCDIHCYVEVRRKDTGRWELYNQPKVERWYDLFARMAGAKNRNNIIPISPPRGLPQDASEMVQIEYKYEHCDWHHASWFSSDELKDLQKWFDEYSGKPNPSLFGYVCGYSPWSIPFYDGHLNVPYSDARLVFWFDN